MGEKTSGDHWPASFGCVRANSAKGEVGPCGLRNGSKPARAVILRKRLLEGDEAYLLSFIESRSKYDNAGDAGQRKDQIAEDLPH